MFPFDPPENIRKPNISFSLIQTRTWMYQGGREMLGLQENQKGNIGKKRVNTTKKIGSKYFCDFARSQKVYEGLIDICVFITLRNIYVGDFLQIYIMAFINR